MSGPSRSEQRRLDRTVGSGPAPLSRTELFLLEIEEAGGCSIFGVVGKHESPQQISFLCPLTDVGEATGICVLGPVAYVLTLDEQTWEGGGHAYLCREHAARVRELGGVLRIETAPASPFTEAGQVFGD